jgi:two-component system chemotaxis response regulator CheB
MESKTTPIRILIVEDTLVARELLVSILQSVPGLQVVGTARNGVEGVRLAKRLKPDVITMDIHMPEMDGFEATRQIMAETPRPVVMISASLNKDERHLTFNALQAGALSVLEKPTIDDPPEVYDYLATQLKLMAEVKVVRRWSDTKPRIRKPEPIPEPPTFKRNGKSKIQLVAIASSTGGPGVLGTILKSLPADFPVPILIVQHITAGFAEGLATWLNQQTPLEVRLARHADELETGQVLIAPDNYHMRVNSMGLISLDKGAPEHGLRPAANRLFDSVARVYGATAIGVILTGMGSDGAEGLRTLRETGAHTIAQDQATSVVFGMPAVAIELGAAEQVLPTNKIAGSIMALL